MLRNYIAFLAFALPAFGQLSTCTQGPQKVVRVGSTLSLTVSCTGLTGSPAYLWSYLSPTQPGAPTQSLSFSSTTAASTNITGCVFGPVNIRVNVTDMTGNINVDVHHGCVQTDAAGNIQYTGTNAVKLTAILGPQTIMDRSCDMVGNPCTPTSLNPWPWEDQLHFNWGKHMGAAQGTNPVMSVDFTKDWETRTGTGTISLPNGSQAVTGIGTSFGAEFCGGATPPCSAVLATAYVIVWYCKSGSAPGCFSSDTTSGRRYCGVVSVASNTSMTVSCDNNPGWALTSCSGCYYTAWAADQAGNTWIVANNYYDNVKSHYNAYYRSGIEDFLGYARWLADAWYDNPYIDQLTCGSGTGFSCPTYRNVSLEGVVLRAMDEDAVAGSPGSSRKWTGLRSYWDYAMADSTRCASLSPTVGACYDLREESYMGAVVDLCAIADPSDATRVANCLTNSQAQLNKWGPQRQSNGSWVAPYCTTLSHNGFCDFTNTLGTVTATNGDIHVSLSGGTWNDATQFCGGGSLGSAGNHKAYVRLGTNPGTYSDSADWDSRGYVATFVDTTHLTLDVNYAGTTASTKGILIGCGGGPDMWVGPTVQPFMLGITSNWMRLGAYAMTNSGASPPFNATLAATINSTWLPGIATFLGTVAADTDSHGGIPDRGPWYGVGGAACQAPYGPAGNIDCSGGSTAQEIRALSPELMHSFTTAYCLNHDPNILTYGDNYFSAMFAKFTGEIGYDTVYLSDYDIGSGNYNGYVGKWWGFFWGYGDNESWLSGRQGCGATSGGVTITGNVFTNAVFQ